MGWTMGGLVLLVTERMSAPDLFLGRCVLKGHESGLAVKGLARRAGGRKTATLDWQTGRGNLAALPE